MILNNRKEVIENDNSIKRQVSGMTTEKEKRTPTNELKNQEYYFRATDYRGY